MMVYLFTTRRHHFLGRSLKNMYRCLSPRLNSGGIDLELAPQVVTALDDVCMLSAPSFDVPSLAAMLGEVCHWLVHQRIGARAQHDAYKSCDPYSQVSLLLCV